MRRRDLLLGAAFAQPGGSVSVPGSTLVHEHVLVDFAGAAQTTPRYDPDEVFRIAKPKLEALKPFGCRRVLECTPNYLARDPKLLARLQDATGIELWTNTGIYGAADRKGVPPYAFQESAEQLARRWIAEWKGGVDGVRPRFIKTGVNGFPLEELDRKLIRAAALTSLETGLTIASHTNGGGPAFGAQLEILEDMKFPYSKFVWVHAQNEKDHTWHEHAARAGAWVEFDGISPETADYHRQCVLFMQSKDLISRTLISQDSGWYHAGEPGGGNYRGYTYIYTGFLPLLPRELCDTLLVENPGLAFGR